jgi:hypothetical protein
LSYPGKGFIDDGMPKNQFMIASFKQNPLRSFSRPEWMNNAESAGMDCLSIRTFDSLHEESKDVRGFMIPARMVAGYMYLQM